MALFDWDEKLATGNAQIDAEHKQLFALAAGLHKAILEAHGHDVIGALLGKLISYTAGHFAHEEALMKATAYPGTATHVGHHHDLVKQVTTLQSEFAAGKALDTLAVMDFLKNWLRHHIGQEDKKLADHAKHKHAA
jgi:hemerythrin